MLDITCDKTISDFDQILIGMTNLLFEKEMSKLHNALQLEFIGLDNKTFCTWTESDDLLLYVGMLFFV